MNFRTGFGCFFFAFLLVFGFLAFGFCLDALFALFDLDALFADIFDCSVCSKEGYPFNLTGLKLTQEFFLKFSLFTQPCFFP